MACHFPKVRFFYIEGDFGDLRFYQALITKLHETKSAYGAAIGGMLAREGICLADHWPIVSGSPNKQLGHISHSKILEGLKNAKLMEEKDIAGIGKCLILNDRFFSASIASFRARLTLEHILRKCIHDWAIRLGWSSNGALQTADDQVLPTCSFRRRKRYSLERKPGSYLTDCGVKAALLNCAFRQVLVMIVLQLVEGISESWQD